MLTISSIWVTLLDYVNDLKENKRILKYRIDHSPIRQSFEFGKSISTAGKSIVNFIQLSSLVAKYCKV